MHTDAILNFQTLEILTAEVPNASPCHFIKTSQVDGCKDIVISRIFKDGGHLPSWICFPHYWTAYYAYFVVFTATQNMVGIYAAVSMI